MTHVAEMRDHVKTASKNKGTPVGVSYRAQGPALGSWGEPASRGLGIGYTPDEGYVIAYSSQRMEAFQMHPPAHCINTHSRQTDLRVILAGPKVGNWTQGEKRGRVSGLLSAPLPLSAQEDP
eukprot:1175545-Prorocentrum_minimum.AAC.3